MNVDFYLLIYFCPNCRNATFFEHSSVEYRGWHKCTHCSYMCLTADHIARIKKVLNEYYKVPLNTETQQKDKEK